METITYPQVPGHRDTDTSREAAHEITRDLPAMRKACLAVLIREPSTADEVAEALGLSILSVRPRITELKKLGLIADTGARRINASGRRAAVMAATT